jgi:hypothetical protein
MATATANLIPGASWLGASMSVFAMGDPSKLARRLFDLGAPQPQTLGSRTYVLPEDVSFSAGMSDIKTTSRVFNNEEEFSTDYRARAKLTGQGAVASGSIDAKWHHLTSGKTSAAVVDVSSLTSRYQLELTHRSVTRSRSKRRPSSSTERPSVWTSA